MTQFNFAMYEGFLLIVGGLRFIQEPLGAALIALGGILTLFEKPAATDGTVTRTTLAQVRTVVGILALVISSIVLASLAFDDVARNQTIVSDSTLNLLTVPH